MGRKWDVMIWNDLINYPSRHRPLKPRQVGVTMVMDKGLGINQFTDLMQTAHDAIDFVKFGFGTSALIPTDIIRKKVSIAEEHSIPVYPGGTLFEVAKHQSLEKRYFATLRTLNFKWVEISDGSMSLSLKEREEAIKLAQSYGLKVITEIGKKEAGSEIDFKLLLETFHQDIHCGAEYVTIEARESGKNVGVCDAEGNIDVPLVQRIIDTTYPRHLLWEAPLKNQQVEMVKNFGSEINLGNVSSQDVLSVETIRRGLRGDTFILQEVTQITY